VLLPDGIGTILLEETSQMVSRPAIIVMTAHGDIDMAVNAMKNGAIDFLQKPVGLTQLEKSVRRAAENVAMRRELTLLRDTQYRGSEFIIGKTAKMKSLFDTAKRAAVTSTPVLITGETGTGKDVLACAMHSLGPRSAKTMVAINCAALQATMLESELFGHEAGAFTGADKKKHGLMEVADGTVLFLDEISSMPLDMQVKLLRALDSRAFYRVGGTTLIKVDVHIIAASNRDLPSMIQAGTFREDLYYRLKVVNLHMSPLRERKEDIPELVGLFIRKENLRMGMNVTDITPRAMEALTAHEWPGNIRELKNVIGHAMLFCDEEAIDLPHLPADIVKQPA
jgi:DNA-binding NtrC family response regulator